MLKSSIIELVSTKISMKMRRRVRESIKRICEQNYKMMIRITRIRANIKGDPVIEERGKKMR